MLGGMMNLLQNVMPGAGNTMQPNMSNTPGFPAPGSLGTLGTGTSGSGGDAGFPAPGSLGPPPGSATSSAPVPIGQSGGNFVPMGNTTSGGSSGPGISIPRPVARTVNRAARQAEWGVSNMIYRSMYRGMGGLRW